ncbi:MAG: hypothetical protein WCP55_24550, partial [Lentisphaerota bacterium]
GFIAGCMISHHTFATQSKKVVRIEIIRAAVWIVDYVETSDVVVKNLPRLSALQSAFFALVVNHYLLCFIGF